MGLIKKISSFRYERRKRKEKRKLEKFNHRQEEYDNIIKNEKQKHEHKSILARLKFETYTKRLVGIIVFIGLFDLQLSYVLAFLGKEQIAETLSIQICVTILGTTLVYVIRAYFDTKAEKRDEMIKAGYISGDKSSIISKDVIRNKVHEVVNDSGVGEHINTDELVLEPENPDDFDYCG